MGTQHTAYIPVILLLCMISACGKKNDIQAGSGTLDAGRRTPPATPGERPRSEEPTQPFKPEEPAKPVEAMEAVERPKPWEPLAQPMLVPPNVGGPASLPEASGNLPDRSAHLGTWRLDGCHPRQGSESFSNILVLNDHSQIVESRFYIDPLCAQIGMIRYLVSSLVMGKPFESEGAQKYDTVVQKVQARVENVAWLAWYNESRRCGPNYFTLNVTRDIMKGDCGGIYDGYVAYIGMSSYDIIKADNATLMTGKKTTEYDKSSDQKRPVTLDTENVWKRMTSN